MKFTVFLYIHCFYISLLMVQAAREKELLVLLMAPNSNYMYNDPAWNIGQAIVPAARLAADQINNRSDLLAGYTLRLLERESGCSLTSKTLINFAEAEFYNSEERGIVGMIGPGCPGSVLATAQQTSRPLLNIVQISVSSSPKIGGSNYINSFRTVPPVSTYIDAFIGMMDAAEWRRVAIVYDNQDSAYGSVFSELSKKMERNLIHPIELHAQMKLNYIFNIADAANVRIIFVLAGLYAAQRLLCERSSFDNFQLVFMDIMQEDILNMELFSDNGNIHCTSGDLEGALNNSIFLTNSYKRESMDTRDTLAGMTYLEYEELYRSYSNKYLTEKKLRRDNLPSASFRYRNAYYDAMWALALALNNTTVDLNLIGLNANNMIGSNEVGTDMRTSLQSISFEGMSGQINFDDANRGLPRLGVVLNQTMMNSSIRKCTFHTGIYINESLVFNETPMNFFPYAWKSVSFHVDEWIVFTLLALATGSVALFLALLVTFIVIGVKAISPHLDYLIFSGCCLYLLALTLYTVQVAFPNRLDHYNFIASVACNLHTWCLSVAFTLIFGTISAKTWRIYRIFTHFKSGRVKYVSDPFLISIIIGLVLVDTIFLMAWNLNDPWILAKWTRRENSLIVDYHYCFCDNLEYWIMGVLVQKLALVFVAILFSILVRPVKRKGFKNTKAILILIYSLIVIHIVGLSCHALLESLQTLYVLNFLGYSMTFALTLVTITTSYFSTHMLPIMKKRMSSSRSRKKSSSSIMKSYNSPQKLTGF